MCVSSNFITSPLNRILDPVGSQLLPKLFGKGGSSGQQPPTLPQPAQTPDTAQLASRARQRAALATGATWLTGPSGIVRAAGNYGAPSLLGDALGKATLGG